MPNMSKQLLEQNNKVSMGGVVDISGSTIKSDTQPAADGTIGFLIDLLDPGACGIKDVGYTNMVDKPGTCDKACESSLLLLKIPLTKQKEFRTTAYNKFTLDLVKASINSFTTQIQREQSYALVRAEYTDIGSVLEALKTTIRRDICIHANIPIANIPAMRLSKDVLVVNGNIREISECKREHEKHHCTVESKDLNAMETLLNFEYLKFTMMEILQKETLEQILDRNSCEMIYTSRSGQHSSSSQFIVKLYSNKLENTRECKRELNDLYYSNIFLTWSDAEYTIKALYIENGIFVRESTGKCTAFGSIKDVQKTIRANVSVHESYFLVDSEMGDFICGKKFGKTMKISRSTDCTLDVEMIRKPCCRPSDSGSKAEVDFYSIMSEEIFYRFKIKGKGNETINCYKFLFDEFPVELCFDLDRKYHKKIIGMKGTTIQKIMKKYNIYAKFMSVKEAQESGFNGNVILKTPRKNAENLEKSKEEILAMSEEEITSLKSPLNGSDYETVSIEEVEAIKYPSIEGLLRLKKDTF